VKFYVRINIYINFCLALLTGVCTSTQLLANERFELDEIIVSGNYKNQTVEQLPKSIAVITSEDIKQAPSNNLVELLAREANVNFSSYTGSDKFSGIDIRGMGETAHSNVVVMLNGVRLNAADLSGADLSSIPLSQIKRIEIIRGSSSVRYGSGAVGGVINIITEPDTDSNKSNLYFSGGSFNTIDTRAALEKTFEDFSLQANIAYYDSDGYRDNSQLEKQDAKLAARFYANDYVTIKASIKAHRDEYGLPGPVSKDDFTGSNKDRESTNSPNDYGETDDTTYNLSTEFDLVDAGFLQLNLSHRNRENPFVIGFTPALTYQEQLWKINEDSSSFDVLHEFNFGSNKLAYGLNYYTADFNRQENGTELIGQSKNRKGDAEDSSMFVTSMTPLSNNININLGYRKNYFKVKSTDSTLVETCDTEFIDTLIEISPGIFITTPIPFETNCVTHSPITDSQNASWNNSAIDLGFIFHTDSNNSIYLNFSQSYRNPNIDELAVSDNDLKPQTGLHLDTGIRTKHTEQFESSFNFYIMEIKNEIRFGLNPDTGLSENHNSIEKTLREGVEIDLKYNPAKSVYIWSSLGYTQAEFKESKTTVPLVPQTTISMGMEWSPLNKFTFSLTGNYVGKQFDGLDLNNQTYDQLDAYQVYNSRFIYRFNNIDLFAGINNISNEVYSTLAFAETYYPMPERNYYAGLSIAFE